MPGSRTRRLRGGALGEQVQQAARDAEGAAANSQEAGRGLLGNRDQALKSGTAQEKDRTRELQDKDRVQEKDSDSVKEQGKAEGAQQTSRPPMIDQASPVFQAEPTLDDSASGNRPTTMAILVINTGRKRSLVACNKACVRLIP